MITSIQEARNPAVADYLPALMSSSAQELVYEKNRHRVYAVAFWMTDNELAAEALMSAVFCNAFQLSTELSADEIDGILVEQLRQLLPLGTLSLHCPPSTTVRSARYNTLRVDLERAVVELPATEKLIFILHDVEGYKHNKIARLLKIGESESQFGLHQARLRIRELLLK